MSEELATIEGGAYLVNFSPDTVKDLIDTNIAGEDVNVFDFGRIAMPSAGGKVFMVPTLDDPDGEAAKEVSGVIMHTHMQRTMWLQPYGEGDDEPDCSARKAIVGIPRDQDAAMLIEDPEHRYGGECSDCPYSQWGSAENGRGQKCTLQRIVYLLMAGDNLPVVVQVPPSSLAAFKSFAFGLARFGVMHYQVEVTLGLITATNKDGVDYSKLTLRKSRELDDREQELVAYYRGAITPHL